MEYTGINKQRKPNLKTWPSPFEEKDINSRGVPSYIRNKLKLPWKPEYMDDPELLLKDIENKVDDDSFLNIKKDIIDHCLSDDLLIEYFQNTTKEYFQTISFLIRSKDQDSITKFGQVIKEWRDSERRKWFTQQKNKVDASRENLSEGSKRTACCQEHDGSGEMVRDK
jgi:hypothetical protein